MPKHGIVTNLFIAPSAGARMQSERQVEAIAGRGLKGDRYAEAAGSYNKGSPGRRQVTLMNERFITEATARGTGIHAIHTRRNIIVRGVELMWLIGRDFRVGDAFMRGVKYCDPCDRPSALCGVPGFAKVFEDGGGLVAEIIKGGIIRLGDSVIPPPKEY